MAEKKPKAKKADGTADVLATLAAMPEPDRTLGERLHAVVTAAAPMLMPKLWYGMPAYANADGQVVCFFQAASKFKTRYATFGFQHAAKLDDGGVWPTSFAVTALNPAAEARLAVLVTQAAN
jgi:uncharacterized protein YdhG (YjbR/CyaY superfamily)